MRIGIDISQTAFAQSGVGRSMTKLVSTLIFKDKSNEYVLFFSSLRGEMPEDLNIKRENVQIKRFKLPPTLLNLLWNKLHVLPIEKLIGDVDVFISSDWTEPPTQKAKKVTFVHDLVVYKFPSETDSKIIKVHKNKFAWAVRECIAFITPSASTKKDLHEILKVDNEKIHVVNWGV